MKTRYSECAKLDRSGFRANEAPYIARDGKAGYSHSSIGRSTLSNRTGFGRRRFNTSSRWRRKRFQSSREARASDTYRIASVIRIANGSGAVAVTQLSRLVTRTRFKRTRSDVFGCPAPSIPDCKECHSIPKQLRSLLPGILSPSTRSILRNHPFSTS
jgi:hypothetical protein